MTEKPREKASRSTVFAATTIVLSILLLGSMAAAAQSESGIDVQVNISQKTIIDISPSSFAWGQGATQVLPGSTAGPSQEQNSYGRIQVENLGSVNITQVWFNTSYPADRPFGTGDASKYDSGNFISIDSNTTSTDRNQFINRKEIGLNQPADKDIIYLSTPADWDYGRFRNTSQEYFWTVDDTGASLSGVPFRIGINPHNETQTGSVNLDNTCQGGDEAGANTDCNGYSLSVTTIDGTDYAYTDVEIGVEDTNPGTGGSDGGPLYCAVMNETQVLQSGSSSNPEVWFVKWNKGFPAANTGDCGYATNYTVGSDGEYSSLVPGDWIVWNIRAKIPYGVVSDNLPTGNLYVLANSQ